MTTFSGECVLGFGPYSDWGVADLIGKLKEQVKLLLATTGEHLPGAVEEMGVPLLPLLFLTVIRLVKNSAGFSLIVGSDPLLWSSELPFSSIVVSATSFIRAHDLRGRLAPALKKRKKSGGDETDLTDAKALNGNLYLQCFALIVAGFAALALLALYYFVTEDRAAGRPAWARTWMWAQFWLALLVFTVSLNVRRLAAKVAIHTKSKS